MLRKFVLLLLTAVLLLSATCPAAFAVESTTDDGESISVDTRVTFEDFETRPLKDGERLVRGIDVSEYQQSIDWLKVAADGIDFAFVRVGYRGYGTSGKLVEDKWYQWNLSQAIRAGIDVGVYIYSQATTVAEAQEEARFVIDRIREYDLQLPIVMDLEFAWTGASQGGRLWNAVASGRLDKTQLTAVCNAFCSTVEAAGYDSMVYCNTDMAWNYVNAPQLRRLWLANYTSINQETGKYPASGYQGDYEFWQFTSNGKVEGIEGKCDLNFWFCTQPEDVTVPTPPSDPEDDGEDKNDDTDTETETETDTEDTPAPVAPPFLDVKEGDWYYDSVAYCYENGIIYGMSDTEFAPESKITRGQIVTMLYRLEGSPAVDGENPFTDLVQDYYKTAILWANQTGVVYGKSETAYDPEGDLTRQDLVTILYRYAGKPASNGDYSSFTDSDQVAQYAGEAVAWAVENGLIVGMTEDTLAPLGTATRAQIAAVLCRYVRLTGE